MYRDLDTVADITKKSLDWMGYVVRLDHGRLLRKVFESKSEGSRRMGRPRMTWLEDVERIFRRGRWKYGGRRQYEWDFCKLNMAGLSDGRRESVKIALPLLCRSFLT